MQRSMKSNNPNSINYKLFKDLLRRIIVKTVMKKDTGLGLVLMPIYGKRTKLSAKSVEIEVIPQ